METLQDSSWSARTTLVEMGQQLGSPTLVLIASPASNLRKRWRHALERDLPVDEVGDFLSLHWSLQQQRPSVLLLDLDLSSSLHNGGLACLHERSPGTKIVLFTKTPRLKEALSALKSGVKGYCHRNLSPALLKKVIEAVQKNEFWLGRKLTSRVLQELTEPSEEPIVAQTETDMGRLSKRERETAALVGKGLNNNAIAQQLQISERTVKAHLASIFSKLGIKSRLNLALVMNTLANQKISPH